jgi:ketosteroid isomerase-like protein
MATPLEVVKHVYNRFAEGDIDGFLALCADNIEWVVNGPANLEKCRAFKGHGPRSPGRVGLQLICSADVRRRRKTVVVLGGETGTDKTSGIRFENRWAPGFDVQDGHVIRFREFLCHWTDQQRPPAMSW